MTTIKRKQEAAKAAAGLVSSAHLLANQPPNPGPHVEPNNTDAPHGGSAAPSKPEAAPLAVQLSKKVQGSLLRFVTRFSPGKKSGHTPSQHGNTAGDAAGTGDDNGRHADAVARSAPVSAGQHAEEVMAAATAAAATLMKGAPSATTMADPSSEMLHAEEFGELDDPAGWAQYLVTPGYVQSCWEACGEGRWEAEQKAMANLTAEVISVDHVMDPGKRVAGESTKAALIVCNEAGQVIAFYGTSSTSLRELAGELKLIQKRHKDRGVKVWREHISWGRIILPVTSMV